MILMMRAVYGVGVVDCRLCELSIFFKYPFLNIYNHSLASLYSQEII